MSGTKTLANGISAVFFAVLEHIPLVSRYHGKQQATPFNLEVMYNNFMSGVEKALTNPKINFIFIHWNIPHSPFGYDRHKDAFLPNERVNEKPVLGYLDNLELTDRAFATMRATLERAKRWDNSTIIVSADHRWRQAEKHDGVKSKLVPFMVKLPGQKKKKIITEPIHTSRTRYLVEKIFDQPGETNFDILSLMGQN